MKISQFIIKSVTLFKEFNCVYVGAFSVIFKNFVGKVNFFVNVTKLINLAVCVYFVK